MSWVEYTARTQCDFCGHFYDQVWEVQLPTVTIFGWTRETSIGCWQCTLEMPDEIVVRIEKEVK